MPHEVNVLSVLLSYEKRREDNHIWRTIRRKKQYS